MIPAPKTTNQNQTYFHKTFRATITAEQLLQDYEELGQWQKVAQKYNVSPTYIIMARKWLGIFEKTVTKGHKYGGQNSKFTKNNGKRKDARGYIIVGRYHPDNYKGYQTYEHVLVIEKHIGRELLPGESVHHIDGDKSNNDISNLYLCDHSLHRKAEQSMIDLVYELYKAGIVGFDKNEGKYFLKDTLWNISSARGNDHAGDTLQKV